MSIKPEGFLVISPNGEAKMIGMVTTNDPISSAINSVPSLIEKVQDFLAKRKGESDEDGDIVISD